MNKILSSKILCVSLAFFWVVLLIPGVLVATAEVTPAPTVQGDSHFGVTWINPPGQVASPQRTRQAVDLGARWDRFPFYWNEIQPAEGSFDFSYLDRAVDNDISHGFQVQGILLGAPGWAVKGGRISPEAWQNYVTQTVSHFKGRVRYWEVWNEPDLINPDGSGVFWHWSVSDFYQLLKTGYKAAKAANPDSQILTGGLAFPFDNLDFFPKLLEEMSRDATAKQNNYYFDILPLHLYGRAGTLFDLPMGYVGSPDFAGFHSLMRNLGFDKPIWVNEAGVGVWDTGTGSNAPGRATQSEHASYIIQAFAYGLAGGVDRIFIFQLYDDGAGANDPSTGKKVEYYGLVSNEGTPRPGYTAYQTAARYFSNAQLVTRINLNRNGSADVKGLDIVTMYGTPNGKVTVLWNNDGNPNQQVRLVADAAQAIRMDKLGQQQSIAAVDGAYTIGLAAATNNNNFGCYTSRGCNPNDFILGGDPVILIEPDYRVPTTVVRPLPSGVRAPFEVTWGTTSSATGQTKFDVQFMDASDGVWRDWITNTITSSAQFGTGSTFTQLNHTYVFRARARDAAGNLLGGYDYSSNGMASTVVLGGSVTNNPPPLPPPAPAPRGPGEVDAKIQIVWPHDNKPVDQATRANIGAYVFNRNGLVSVNPSFDRPAKLYRARNNDVEEEVATGTKDFITRGLLKFPVWQFNDVDVSFARDRLNKLFFRVAVEGANSFGNIWSHGADARTYFPLTDVPAKVLSAPPSMVDAKIEIVWPQDNLPVEKAARANVGVYLFEHGTLNSLPLDYDRPVRLWQTLNNNVEKPAAVGVRTTKTEKGITFPIWEFNDVDVSAARDGLSKYYLRVSVDGVRTYSNVWSHGKDARTNFPKADEPSGVLP
ncbi:MAG: endo-1,4-beta-xylanase [Chloroflexi bacterium]|nr:endo-1,4-beta-xylanase [Chloroflexota bacterium]